VAAGRCFSELITEGNIPPIWRARGDTSQLFELFEIEDRQTMSFEINYLSVT